MNRSTVHALKLSVFVTVLMLSSVAGAATVEAPQTVSVIGTGRIHGENVSAARELAISNALVTAVGIVVAGLVPEPILPDKFQVLNQRFYSRADRFIQDYKVLAEAVSGRKYRVMVQVTVFKTRIQSILSKNELIPKMGTGQRVLLLMAEQNLENGALHYWWGNSIMVSEAVSEGPLTEALRQKDLTVIDHNQTLPPVADPPDSESEIHLGYHLDDTSALFLGYLYKAHIVVVGTAKSVPATNVMGETLKSFQGTLTLRALRTETGQILASTMQSAFSMDADNPSGGRKALVAVAEQAAGPFATQIISSWHDVAGDTHGISVVVEGTRQLVQFVKFRMVLDDLEKVSDLQTQEIKPNEAILSLIYEGPSQALAEALLLKSFDGFGIHISEVTTDEIKLSLVPPVTN
ncbi:MAG: hypothetical protein JRH15_09670 [Deltaproteobacteria bacterium]|nr:hypothetical protein [Deltaproteobacteria bacterium]